MPSELGCGVAAGDGDVRSWRAEGGDVGEGDGAGAAPFCSGRSCPGSGRRLLRPRRWRNARRTPELSAAVAGGGGGTCGGGAAGGAGCGGGGGGAAGCGGGGRWRQALQVAAVAAVVPRAEVEEVARQLAARPSAVLLSALPSAWAFRRDPVLPWLAPRPAARRSVHAMAELANCIAVRAVVASSRRRSFVMMVWVLRRMFDKQDRWRSTNKH